MAVAYWNAPRAALVLDGPAIVAQDARIQAFEPRRLHDVLFGDYWGLVKKSGLYRPLTTFTYAIDYALLGHGTDAAGYVLFNVALHALNVLLWHSILRRIGLDPPAAFAGALLWAVHPLGTEAITNVVGRADLLAALGVLAGWRLNAGGGAARLGIGRSVGLFAASALAIGAKESGVVLLGGVVLHDALLLAAERERAREGLRWWLRRAISSYVFVAAGVLLWLALRSVAVGRAVAPPAVDNPLVLLPPLAASAAAVALLLRYAWLAVWPLRLSADHSWNDLPVTAPWLPIAGGAAALLLAGAALLAWRRRRRWPVAALLFLFPLVAFAPASNVALRIGTVFAERIAYLPAAGWLALAGVGFARWRARAASAPLRRAAMLALALAVALLTIRTLRRNRDWHSPLELFAAAVEAAPRSFKAHDSYAAELYLDAERRGTRRERIDLVLRHAELAKEILAPLPVAAWPPGVLANLAAFLRAKASLVPADEAGRWRADARRQYDEALRIESEVLGRSESEEERAPKAGSWRLRKGLAQLLQESGDLDGALAAFESAAALAPGPEVLLDQAGALESAGRHRESAIAAARVILLDPRQAEASGAWEAFERAFAAATPGVVAVQRASDGSRRFDTRLPSVRELLEEAARLQYAAILRLGQERAAEGFRRSVIGSIQFDPAAR